MEDRLTELEIKAAHMEEALNEMSDVLISQQTSIDKLELTIQRLRDRMEADSQAHADSDPAAEKPPHY